MMRKACISSIRDTAEYLGIPESKLLALIDEGRIRVIPPTVTTSIHESDLRAFLESTTTDTVSGLIAIPRRHPLARLLRRA